MQRKYGFNISSREPIPEGYNEAKPCHYIIGWVSLWGPRMENGIEPGARAWARSGGVDDKAYRTSPVQIPLIVILFDDFQDGQKRRTSI